jgi:hypothetical protein
MIRSDPEVIDSPNTPQGMPQRICPISKTGREGAKTSPGYVSSAFRMLPGARGDKVDSHGMKMNATMNIRETRRTFR